MMMMPLAKRMERIRSSPTLVLNTHALMLKAQGVDVLSLATGEPDFATPAWIKDAAVHAMDQEWTKYTAVDGIPTLKEAIIQKFKRDNDLSYTSSEIMVSTGGKQVIFNAFMATLNPGDEVIIPAPYWVSYPEMVRFFEGTPVCVPCFEENHFKITASDLEKHITPHTKWLILNSPSNPTGALYTKAELKEISEVLLKHPHVWVMSDDIYEHLIYDDYVFYNILNVCPALKERTLIINGLSKSYAMTGWRLGYGAGDTALIQAMTLLQSQSTSNPCSITQGAAIGALNGPHDFLKTWCDIFLKRRNLVLANINTIKGLHCVCPAGAFYLYVNCHGLLGLTTPEGSILQNDADVSLYFLEHARVAVMPGSAFGLSPYFRISYATGDMILEQALQRMTEAVGELR